MSQLQNEVKALFGCDGTVPLGDRFCCEHGLLSVLKRLFVWDNGTAPSQPNRPKTLRPLREEIKTLRPLREEIKTLSPLRKEVTKLQEEV